uniref:AGC protein kinase n=1 Tax=Peronospora matthiolae TaxID=2874970 RepID=A0AAV1VLS1_9STRA
MSSSKTETSPEAADNESTILESVKTWTFAQLLASSFAKASLKDEDEDEDPVAVTSERTLKKNDERSKGGVESNDWDCSYSCLQPVASARTTSSSVEGPHTTDWDCPYNRPKPAALRPRVSASSSSSTLLLDAAELGHSIDELLDDIETADERTEEEVTGCRALTRHVFDIVRIIGSGTYGTVLLCRLRACPDRLFAVKVVYKSKLGSFNGLDGDGNPTREAKRLLTEKEVLCSVDHPFIIKMFCSFETPDALNFVLEYCHGGDMYFLLEKCPHNRLAEDHVLFYAASIALALHYLHGRGILYRDLKPENILLDEAGFVRLADFGFAREHVHRLDQNCSSFCGSADYVAPEVIRGDGYGLAADLWSFGCVVYELLTGYPPFYSPRDRASLFRKINEEEPRFSDRFSPELCDFLSGLLHKDVCQRLGNGPNGMQDIFDHPFFASISWNRLETKRVKPPIVPKLASKLDTSNFEDQFTLQQVKGHLEYKEPGPRDTENQLFLGEFDWCADASHFQ